MKKLLLLSVLAIGILVGCEDDTSNPPANTLTLNLTGLEDLGSNFAYEGWIVVGGSPVSTGTFTVDGSGNLSQTAFTVDPADLAAATEFVLSIEPVPDVDPAPADTKLLAGAFSGSSATLGTGTVGTGFDMATGLYIIAAPTGTGDPGEEFSGIWFMDTNVTPPVAGLDLPTLEPGWAYEGWVVVGGTPLTTGTFTDVNTGDDAAPFSGANSAPNYPGEDFLVNAPAGVTFPTDLRGMMTVISIEPVPDNDPAPFTLKPLAASIPGTLTGDPYAFSNNTTASFPTGTVQR